MNSQVKKMNEFTENVQLLCNPIEIIECDFKKLDSVLTFFWRLGRRLGRRLRRRLLAVHFALQDNYCLTIYFYSKSNFFNFLSVSFFCRLSSMNAVIDRIIWLYRASQDLSQWRTFCHKLTYLGVAQIRSSGTRKNEFLKPFGEAF